MLGLLLHQQLAARVLLLLRILLLLADLRSSWIDCAAVVEEQGADAAAGVVGLCSYYGSALLLNV
jgi:hypothetical protein